MAVLAALTVVALIALPRPGDGAPRAREPGDRRGANWDAVGDGMRTGLGQLQAGRARAESLRGSYDRVSRIDDATHRYVVERVAELRGEIARIDALSWPTDRDRAERAACAEELRRLVR